MKIENKLKALHQESTLFCGGLCVRCLFEDNCPLLVKYKPIIEVDSVRDDGILVVRCLCHTPKEKKSDNG